MVFRRQGKINTNEKSTYNNEELEVVNDFNYLDTVFNYTWNFGKNQEHLAGKPLKACDMLIYKCKDINLKPKIQCQLFDSFVSSILCYSSEL